MSHDALGNQFEMIKAADVHRRWGRGIDGEDYPASASIDEDDEGSIIHSKVQESIETGLADHIEKYGVQAPISVEDPYGRNNRGYVTDGWHRLSTALAIDPDMKIPVLTDRRSGDLYSPDQFDEKGRELPKGRKSHYDDPETPNAGPAKKEPPR